MKTLDWIKEIRKVLTKILGFKYLGDDVRYAKVDNIILEIKTIISDLLLSQHKERMERIKGMKRKPEIETGEDLVGLTFMTIDNRNYNQAIDDLIKEEQSLYGGER